MSGDQLSLRWGTEPRSRHTDPSTSNAAAGEARSLASSHRDLIVEILRESGPLTPEEIADLSAGAMDKVQVCKRVKELERLERIEVSTNIKPRENRSGSRARVWRACG